MRGPHKPKRWPWALLGASALLAGVSAAAMRLAPSGPPVDAELAHLRATAEGSREFNEGALARLHAEATAHPVASWRTAEAEKLLASLSGWRCEWKDPTPNSRTAQITLTDANGSAWASGLELVRTCGRMPGILLQATEWTASGAGSRRSVNRVVVTLRFATSLPSSSTQPKSQ